MNTRWNGIGNAKPYRIGLIGFDSDQSVQTAHWFNRPDESYSIPGAVVNCAYDTGNDDFFNRHRAGTNGNRLQHEYGVKLVHSIEQLAEHSDALFLSSIDARHRLAQFHAIAEYGKPIIIEKPLTLSVREAEELFEAAERNRIPVFCSSSLRYAETYANELARGMEDGAITGIDCMGPLELQPQLPGLFWNGVHLIELLFAAYGAGCVEVMAFRGEGREHIVGRWKDGRIGTVHGDLQRHGKRYFALLHRELMDHPLLIDVRSARKPDLVSLLEQAVQMLRSGILPIAAEEMLEVVRFMEAANKSRTTGTLIAL